MDTTGAIRLVRDTVIRVSAGVDSWFDTPESKRAFKPSAGWSINEVLEHIALTNHYLLLLIGKAASKAVKRSETAGKIENEIDYEERLKRIDVVGVHLSFTWVRPEHMEPGGDADMEGVRMRMRDQFGKCLEILDGLKNGEGALAKTTMTVSGLGKIDVYEYIYFLAMHAKRHIAQMEKVAHEAQMQQ